MTGEGFFRRQNQERERISPNYQESYNNTKTQQQTTDYMGSIDKDLKNLLGDDHFRLTNPCRTDNFIETKQTDYFRNTGMSSIDPHTYFPPINNSINNNKNYSQQTTQQLSANQRRDLEDKLMQGLTLDQMLNGKSSPTTGMTYNQ